MSAREDLLSETRKVLWQAWASSSDEIGSVAAEALLSLGMLVEPGGAGELVRLRARVAELEQERDLANAALDDAAQALRERQTEREVLVRRMRAGQRWQRGRTPELVSEDLVSQPELRKIFGIPLMAPWEYADGITRRLAPVQVLGEVPDGEHYAAVHHTYRLGHDLPDSGGVS
jgi:hypothetical protein